MSLDDTCPKCGSKNVARTKEWYSYESKTVYAIDLACMDCEYEWSW